MGIGYLVWQEETMAGQCLLWIIVRLCEDSWDAEARERSQCNGQFIRFQMPAS
jgi:hypothetical protein